MVTTSDSSQLETFEADWPGGQDGLTSGILMIPAFLGLLFLIWRHGGGVADVAIGLLMLAIPGLLAMGAIWQLLDHSPFLKISRDELRFHPSVLVRPIRRDMLETIDVNLYNRFSEQPDRFDLSAPMTKSGVPIGNIIIFYRLNDGGNLKKYKWVSGENTEKYYDILQNFGWQ